MKIIAVRIGEKYGPEYERYLESKLPDYEFIWVRKPIQDNVMLQWNKMYGMNLDVDFDLIENFIENNTPEKIIRDELSNNEVKQINSNLESDFLSDLGYS